MPETAVGELQALWSRSLEDLQRELSGPLQRAWLDDTTPVGFSHDTVVLAAPHGFARDALDSRYRATLRETLTRHAGRPVSVVVTVRSANDGPNDGPNDGAVHGPGDGTGDGGVARDPLGAGAAADGAPATAAGTAAAEEETGPRLGEIRAHDGAVDEEDGGAPPPRRRRSAWAPEQFPRPSGDRASSLNEKYTFDRFVIGASNRFAHAASFAVAEAPAIAYNPLFVYGGAGLGKTHLLQAVGHYATHLYPSLKVRYVTSEQFTNEFIDAISHGRQVPFQQRYRGIDILLIDDIQFLETKERTQEEFFHTFNALHNAQKQIVITSDRPPKQIGQLEERLRTRFEMGLITDIQPPDLETRLAILRKKSGQEGLRAPDDVLELIASRIASNIRELEGALLRVTALASLERSPVTLQLAQLALKDLFPDAGGSEIGVGLIMAETAEYFGLTLDDLCSTSRTRQLVTARQIAMYLTRELTELSLPKIGQAFGGRDHTTVMHANNKISGLMQERQVIFEQVQELTSRIKTAARHAR